MLLHTVRSLTLPAVVVGAVTMMGPRALAVAQVTSIAKARSTGPTLDRAHPGAGLGRRSGRGSEGTESTRPVLRLRVYREGSLSAADAAAARRTVETVFGRAGVGVNWADCIDRNPDCAEPATTATLVVRFLGEAGQPSPACSQITRLPGVPSSGVITVRLPCVRDLLRRLRFDLGTDDGSRLLAAGTIVGALLVHEIGHALNEPHADRGVMRETLTRAEWCRLADGTLSFTDSQAGRLRSAASTTSAVMLAQR